jgi:N-methylhydantoinase B
MKRAASDLLEYSEELMRAFLAQVPPGEYAAEDFLDDDGVSSQPVRLSVRIRIGSGSCVVDFTGSDPQVEGSINAVEAITWSAVFYVFRGLLAEDVPATAGLLRPIQVIAPAGTVVNARPPGAVAGGNVETSQRIVDVLLRALAQALPERIPAAASGTMNNLTIGGVEFLPEDECLTGADRAQPRPYTSQAHTRQPKPFAYYETVAGGMGARPTKDGVSGVHTHMTNSLNTPAEALEYAYPFRVTRYSLRRGSGGPGKYRGGDGIVREIEVLADAEVTILSDRRKRGPYGLAGGGEGQPGKTEIIRLDGSVEILPSKGSARLKKGERVRVETPGGGGFGKQ